MTRVTIRPAVAGDAPRLHRALESLSADLGDAHRADEADLLDAGFGAVASFRAVLAEPADAEGAPLLGVGVFSPVYSTKRGAAGVYVSDLWVAPAARSTGLGRRLLAASAAEAGRAWRARFLRLTAYDDNPAALAFYGRLGFEEPDRERHLALEPEGFARLIRTEGDCR
ncbi:MAG: N-acetyltransferase [Pseudomonadota bacterium]